MANNLLVNGIVTKEALSVLRNKMPMVQKVNKQYQATVRDEGVMSGDTINIRKPAKYIGRTGELAKVESTVQNSIPLTMGFFGQDVSFSQKDLQMSMDDVKRGGLRTILEPAMDSVAKQIEAAGTALYRGINTSLGTPGTPPTGPSGLAAIAQANAYITMAGGRTSNRAALIDPFANASLTPSLTTIFNPSKQVSEQYLEGRMGTAFGFDFYEEAFVATHTAGTYGGSPVVNGGGQTGSTLVTNGWTATTTTLNVGDTFTIAGVFGVNTYRQSTGQLQYFVVTQATTTDASGNSTIQISPAITPTGAFQNVSNAPANGAAIVVRSGASQQASRQSMLFAPEAFTFASAPLALPGGVAYAGREDDPISGLSMRVVQAYDFGTNQIATRFDVFAGWAITYPELAVRLQG